MRDLYGNLRGSELTYAFAQDIWDWAGTQRKVYWIGDPERLEALIEDAYLDDSVTVVAKLDRPASGRRGVRGPGGFGGRGGAGLPGGRGTRGGFGPPDGLGPRGDFDGGAARDAAPLGGGLPPRARRALDGFGGGDVDLRQTGESWALCVWTHETL